MSPGVYTGTVISGNSFSSNLGNGVTLTAARGITLGGPAAGVGNTIIFNGGFGLNASGTSTGSLVQGNQISNNVRGNVANFAARNWFTQISSAPGLTLRVDAMSQAAAVSQQLGLYSFGTAIVVIAPFTTARATACCVGLATRPAAGGGGASMVTFGGFE